MTFDDYNDARAYAEAQTRALKQPHGIEKMPNPLKGKDATCFSVKMLPSKPLRAGWELRCETFEVDDEIKGETNEFYEWVQSQARKLGHKEDPTDDHPRLRALSAAAWMVNAESCEKDAQPGLQMSAHGLFTLLRDTWAHGRQKPLHAYVMGRLDAMRLRPDMYAGSPDAVEAQCWLLVDLVSTFCSPVQNDAYQAFRAKRLPKCPGPMSLAQWFTDKKHGDPRTKDRPDLDHWAGVQIVEFHIAYIAHLRNDAHE